VVGYPNGYGEPDGPVDAEARWLPQPHELAEGWPDPPESLGMDDGIPHGLDAPRLKALGNALVPRIAELIGKRIVELDA
jgi:hypothetical protein